MERRNRIERVVPRPLPPALIGDREIFCEKTLRQSKIFAYVYTT